MSRIDVSVKDGQVQMIINGAGPGQTTLTMDPDMASRVGAALIGMAGETRVVGSLFSLEPMMTVATPSFALFDPTWVTCSLPCNQEICA